jgi:hypothetical protein
LSIEFAGWLVLQEKRPEGDWFSTRAIPAEKTNLAGFRGPTTSLRAIHLELIPACRPASFIGTPLRPLAPPGHPAIAALFAAVALPCHGSDHSHKSSVFQRVKLLTGRGSCGIINGTEEHLSPREPGAGVAGRHLSHAHSHRTPDAQCLEGRYLKPSHHRRIVTTKKATVKTNARGTSRGVGEAFPEG